MSKFWLLKSEPTTFSYQDLLKEPKQTTCWNGIRNYQARNFLRDEFKKGDLVIFYHSSCDIPAAIGTAEVVREGYPEKEEPWVMVDIKALKEFRTPVTREMMAKESRLKEVMVMKKGSRLSVQPLKPVEYTAICELGES